MSDTGKTTIVTGASSGIGYGIAKALLSRGENVIINARNEQKLIGAAERLGDRERIGVVAGDIGAEASA